VRGPNYLKQRDKNVISLKQPSAEAPYTCIGLNVFKSPISMAHSAYKVEECREFLESHPKDDDLDGLPLFLIVCWMFSNFFQTEHTIVQHVFKRTSQPRGEDPALDAAVERFLRASETGKNEQFKYMFKVVNGPPAMLTAVATLGGERPVLIGKRLTTQYHRGDNYLEIGMHTVGRRWCSIKLTLFYVDMDVGSSVVASMLNSVSLSR
jgi:hypothetical protein